MHWDEGRFRLVVAIVLGLIGLYFVPLGGYSVVDGAVGSVRNAEDWPTNGAAGLLFLLAGLAFWLAAFNLLRLRLQRLAGGLAVVTLLVALLPALFAYIGEGERGVALAGRIALGFGGAMGAALQAGCLLVIVALVLLRTGEP